MRQSLLVILLIAASLLCFMGYCAMLIDWVTDLRTGVYYRHHVEAALETTALSLYTYLAIRFINSKTTLL